MLAPWDGSRSLCKMGTPHCSIRSITARRQVLLAPWKSRSCRGTLLRHWNATAGTLQCSDFDTKICQLAMEGCKLLNQPLWQSPCSSRPSISTSVVRVLCLHKADQPLRMSGLCSLFLLTPAARSAPPGMRRTSSSPLITTAGVCSDALPLHGLARTPKLFRERAVNSS